VTVKDQGGRQIFSANKIYEVHNLHFSHNKTGYLGLNYWDLTAMDQLHLGLEPHQIDSLTYFVPLEEGTTSADIESTFRFLYEKGREAVIHRKVTTVKFGSQGGPSD